MIDSKFKVFVKDKKKITSPMQKNSITYICGATGQGKSTILMNLMLHMQEKIEDIEEVYYFTGSKKDKIINFIGEDVIVSHDPEFFMKLLQSIETETVSPRRVLILDDLISNPFFNLNYNKSFINFLLNHRHNNVTFLISSQGFHMLNKQIRSQTSLIFCFPPRNETQKEDILKELPVNKQKLIKALDIIENAGDNEFLYINLQTAQPKFFRGFQDEINF